MALFGKLWWWTVKNREERRIRNMSQEELQEIIHTFLYGHRLDPDHHAYIHDIGQRIHDGEDIPYKERKTVLDLMERLHRDPTVEKVKRG